MDPIFQGEERKWWFWDETWTDALGPFETETVARGKLDEYAEFLDHGPGPHERDENGHPKVRDGYVRIYTDHTGRWYEDMTQADYDQMCEDNKTDPLMCIFRQIILEAISDPKAAETLSDDTLRVLREKFGNDGHTDYLAITRNVVRQQSDN